VRAVSTLIDSLRRIVAREIALLRDFALSPRGVFETIDEAIRIVREELRLAGRVAEKKGGVLRG
jgi:hypothetical protein